MDTLGKRIANYRKAAGLSQGGLAIACGWKSQSRVGNYESGTREPTLADLEKIAAAVGVSVAQLAYGAPLPSAEPASSGQVEATPPARRAAMLAALATPRSQEALERIARAANEGRLTEADLILLEQIASRFESSASTATEQAPLANGNQRLKERLRNNDPGTQR